MRDADEGQSAAWLTAQEVAALAGEKVQNVQRAFYRAHHTGTAWRARPLRVRLVSSDRGGGNGGKSYQVDLASLPESLQAKWRRAHAPAIPLAEGPVQETPPEPCPWPQELRERRHAENARLASSIQIEGRRCAEVVRVVESLMEAGAPKLGACAEAAKDAGVRPRTVRAWFDQCKGHDRGDWHVLLAPGYRGRDRDLDLLHPADHDAIRAEYFRKTQPSLKAIYRRQASAAAACGRKLPSYATVRRIIMSEPRWFHRYKREGRESLEKMYPHQQRDRTTLRLHEQWCADGHKANLFVRWPDGSAGRPIVVAFLEQRTAYFLGYAVGKVESADLVNRAFLASARGAPGGPIIPESTQLDSGRGFAGKEVSGGAPNRYRFRVREDEPLGSLTMMGIKINWALPYNARTKPIEPAWRLLTEMARQFPVTAYAGNRVGARPEECDPAKAVPIGDFIKELDRTFAEYNARPHRGFGMEGKSPFALYQELLPQTVVRQPTREQLERCMLKTEVVRLNREDHAIRVMKNWYWNVKLADLDPGVDYVVRYNPENAEDALHVYRGEQFICRAELQERSGFRNAEKAKEYSRSMRGFVKAKVLQANALKGMNRAASWDKAGAGELAPNPAAPAIAAALPAAPVVTPLRPARDYRPSAEEEEPIISRDEAMKMILEANRERQKRRW